MSDQPFIIHIQQRIHQVGHLPDEIGSPAPAQRLGRQSGIAIVEFSMVSLVLLMVLFAIMDGGRYMHSSQMLNDMTRKAARLATVCYVLDKTDIPALHTITVNAPVGFHPQNLHIAYLDLAGNVVLDPVGDFSSIAFVRARVSDVSYQFMSLLSVFNSEDAFPEFETILPIESLGVIRPNPNNLSGTKTNC
jgi:hypothetical protein